MDFAFHYTPVEQLRIVRQNLIELLHQRGYQVVDDLPEQQKELTRNFPDRGLLYINATSPNSGPIRVIFSREHHLGVNNIQPYLQQLTHHSTLILVVRGPLSPQARKSCDAARRLELYHEHELMFNPTTHIYSARNYRVVTLKDVPAVVQSTAELPKLRSTDPVARWMGFKSGQVICSEIETDTNGPTSSFRVVT